MSNKDKLCFLTFSLGNKTGDTFYCHPIPDLTQDVKVDFKPKPFDDKNLSDEKIIEGDFEIDNNENEDGKQKKLRTKKGNLLNINLQAPSVEIKGKSNGLDLKGPNSLFENKGNFLNGDLNINLGGIENSVKLPKGQLEVDKKIEADADFKMDIPNLGGLNMPNTKNEIKADLKMPDAKLNLDNKFNADANFNLDFPKVGGNTSGKLNLDLGEGENINPGLNLDLDGGKLPKGQLDIKGNLPKFGIKPGIEVQNDISGGLPSGKVNMAGGNLGGLDLSLPSANIQSKPIDANLNINKGIGLNTGNLGKSDLGIDVKGPSFNKNLDINKPNLNNEFNADFQGNLPKANLNLDNKLSGDANFNLDFPKVDGNTSGKLNLDLGEGENINPGLNLDLDGGKLPKGQLDIKGNLPKFGIKPGIEVQNDISGGLPSGKVNMAGGNLGGLDLSLPSANIQSKPIDANLNINKGIGLNTGNLGKADLGIDVKGPSFNKNLDINKPNLNNEFNADFQGNLPKANLNLDNKLSGDANFNLDFPKVGGNTSGKLNLDLGEGENIKPGLNLDLDGGKLPKGQLDIKGNLPKFGIKPGIDVQNDISGGLPSGKVNMAGGNLGGLDLSLPSANIQSKPLDANLNINKGIDFDTGNLGKADLKIGAPSLGIDAKSPLFKKNLDINMPNTKNEFNADFQGNLPKANLNLDNKLSGDANFNMDIPKNDVELSANALQGKFGMQPNFGVTPKMNLGDNKKCGVLDLDVKGSMPKGKLKLNNNLGLDNDLIEAPKYDLSLNKPKINKEVEVDVTGIIPKGKMNINNNLDLDSDMKLNPPKFGISVEEPKLKKDVKADVKLEAPKFGISGKAPKINADINADIEGGIPKGKMNFDNKLDLDDDLKIGAPKFGFSGKTPGVNIKAGEGINADLKRSLNKPDLDIEKKDLKLNMPKFGLQGKGPEINEDIDIDINANPTFGKIKGKNDAQIGLSRFNKGIDLDIEGDNKLSGGIKGPNFNKDIDVNVGGKIEKPKLNFNIGKPSIDLEGKGATMNKDLNLDVEGNISPKINLKNSLDAGAKLNLGKPSIDLEKKAPGKNLQLGLAAKTPSAQLNLDNNIEGNADLTVNKPRFGLFANFPSGEADKNINANVNFKGPKIEGSADKNINANVNFKGPKIDVSADKNINANVNFKGPNIGVSGTHLSQKAEGDYNYDGASAGVVYTYQFGLNGKPASTLFDLLDQPYSNKPEIKKVEVHVKTKLMGSSQINMKDSLNARYGKGFVDRISLFRSHSRPASVSIPMGQRMNFNTKGIETSSNAQMTAGGNLKANIGFSGGVSVGGKSSQGIGVSAGIKEAK